MQILQPKHIRKCWCWGLLVKGCVMHGRFQPTLTLKCSETHATSHELTNTSPYFLLLQAIPLFFAFTLDHWNAITFLLLISCNPLKGKSFWYEISNLMHLSYILFLKRLSIASIIMKISALENLYAMRELFSLIPEHLFTIYPVAFHINQSLKNTVSKLVQLQEFW